MDLYEVLSESKLTGLTDHAFVSLLYNDFSDELERLKGAVATVETSVNQDVRLIPGTLARTRSSTAASPSYALYGTEFTEVNRTLVGILALKWTLSGDYDSFTRPQDPASRMRRASFDKFRSLVLSFCPKPEDVYDLIVSLILGDIGKDPCILAKLQKRQPKLAKGMNHDQALLLAVQSDDFKDEFRILHRLPSARMTDIVLGLQFAAEVNVPQLIQGECVPASLRGAGVLKGKPRAFHLKYLEIMLDVAGAAGHVDARGSLTFSQPVFEPFMHALGALQDLVNRQISERQCYDAVLEHRWSIVTNAGYKSRYKSGPSRKALGRLLAMGRVCGPAYAAMFEAAFTALDPATQETLVQELNIDGLGDQTAVIPYYMPALLAVSRDNVKNERTERGVEAFTSIFRFLTKVLVDKPRMSRRGGVMEREVRSAKGIVQSEAFRLDPKVLDQFRFEEREESDEIRRGARGLRRTIDWLLVLCCIGRCNSHVG